ncbi:MAG: hypothetical protein Q7S52_03445 [bacterium]|nr:hypothetical protein [bacterium]
MKKFIACALAPAFFFGAIAFIAQGASTYENPIKYGNITTIPQLLLALVDLVLLIGVPIIVIFIIYGGFLFVKSGDNESELAKAKNVFWWTLVGALVLLGAKAIELAIEGTITGLQ